MKKKAAFIGNRQQLDRVYGGGRRERVAEEFDLYSEVITPEILAEKPEELKEIEYLFSTWGMTALDQDQIAMLPSLEAVFYGAAA